jgi:hypothetical protein
VPLWPPHPVQRLVRLPKIEMFRRKITTCPGPVVVELLVLWVKDGLKKLTVSTDATDILRWTTPGTA